jgi:hypothetical protein
MKASGLLWLYKPHHIYLVSNLASILAWSVPEGFVLRKGFDPGQTEVQAAILAIVVIFCTYFLIWFSYLLGANCAISYKRNTWTPSIDDNTAYALITLLASIGVIAAYSKIVQHFGFMDAIDLIVDGKANLLKAALYEDYQRGLLSLRYTSILGASLAICRGLLLRRISMLDLLNVLTLLLNAMLASRLALIATTLIASGLWVANASKQRIYVPYLLWSVACLMLLLAIYNYTRNVQFYDALGSSGVFESAWAEMIAYLGAPFQGLLATVDNPNFFYGDVDTFYRQSGIELSLTTNSAVAHLSINGGWFGLAYGGVVILGASFLMGILSKHRRSFLGLVFFILLYCFAELWRVFLFDQGIVATLLLSTLLVVIASGAAKSVLVQVR